MQVSIDVITAHDRRLAQCTGKLRSTQRLLSLEIHDIPVPLQTVFQQQTQLRRKHGARRYRAYGYPLIRPLPEATIGALLADLWALHGTTPPVDQVLVTTHVDVASETDPSTNDQTEAPVPEPVAVTPVPDADPFPIHGALRAFLSSKLVLLHLKPLLERRLVGYARDNLMALCAQKYAQMQIR